MKAQTEIHRAGWVAVDPDTVFENGFVRVENGIIRETGTWGRSSHLKDRNVPVIDHGPGALMPGCINAHTHLELTALKGRVLYANGFQNWVRTLLQERESLSQEIMISGILAGLDELREAGCAAMGEISTLALSRNPVQDSGMAGVWFREFLGNDLPETASCNEKTGHAVSSLACHAPHTTGPQVMQNLKQHTRQHGLPFSIHLAESEDEIAFLTTGKGAWADFLKERGMDFSSWGLPVKSPVCYLEQLGLLDADTLAVHVIHAGKEDLEILKKYDVSVCLCPRSNINLHQRLPAVENMIKTGLNLCIGTDSPASADSLNLFDEMRFLMSNIPSVSAWTVFKCATINGAKALGIDHILGALIPGKLWKPAYVPVRVSSARDIFDAIIHEKGNKP